MLREIDYDEWAAIDIDAEKYVLLATDNWTIGRKAENCEDRAWALEITGSRLKDFEHCVIATRRNEDDDAWLALCER